MLDPGADVFDADVTVGAALLAGQPVAAFGGGTALGVAADPAGHAAAGGASTSVK